MEASFAEHLHEYVLPRGLKDFLRAGPVLEYEPVVDRDPGLPLAGDASPGIGKLPEDVLVHITRFLC